VVFDSGAVRTAKACYYRIALDLIESYANDAAINGLSLDRHAEEQAVELFAANILKAGEAYLEGGEESPFIPSWHRVTSVYRNVYGELIEAVAADRAEHATGSAVRAAVA
jgi:glucosyl-3-phosphoglycerate synthase